MLGNALFIVVPWSPFIVVPLIFRMVRLVTILKIRGTNRKRTLNNKIAGIKRNGCSIPYLTRNNFVLYFSTKKRMVGNEKVKLFIMNGDLF